MNAVQQISEIVTRLESSDVSGYDEPAIRAALGQIATVQTWVDRRKIALTHRLSQLAAKSSTVNAQHVLATAGNISRFEAYREVQRASALEHFPELAKVFAAGRISTAHLDVMSRTLQQLDPLESAQLTKRGEWLNNIATHTTPDNFARAIKQEVARIHNDGGSIKLKRQCRDAILRHWVDRDSGMVHLHGRLDPETGLRVIGRIEQGAEQLFHGALPENCPTDERKQGHLAALALVALVDGGGLAGGNSAGPGLGGSEILSSHHSRAEVSVLIDYQTLLDGLHDNSIVHTGFNTELPLETIRRMACEAQIIPVVLGSNGVVLDVGRGSRLASRHQRLALEAMYSHCAIPDCHVSVNRCQPHHIQYWRNDGHTDMSNLVPLCSTHHRNVHEDRWALALDPPTRELTVTYPGGGTTSSLPHRVRPETGSP